MKPRLLSLLVLVLAFALPMLACENPMAEPPAGEGGAEVRMTDDKKFTPQQVQIRVGETVRWINDSGMVHTVTAVPEAAMARDHVSLPEGAQPFDSGEIQPGDTFAHTFETPGTYRYICTLHEADGMIGEVEVLPTR